MGTRGAVGVKVNGKYYCTYNNSDSYPSWLGNYVLLSAIKISTENGWDKFKENFLKLKMIKDYSKPVTKKYAEYYGKEFNINVNTMHTWGDGLRCTDGDNIIEFIYNNKIKHFICETEFMKESAWCEYAYTINLDDMKFECWKGYQKRPQKGNYFGTKNIDGYYPCAIVGKLPLKKLNFLAFEYLIEGEDCVYKLIEPFYEKEGKNEQH